MAAAGTSGSAGWSLVSKLTGLHHDLTPCMPCSFRLLAHSRSGMHAEPTGLVEVTVTVRWIPLVTAAYGMHVARPASATTLVADGDGSQLGRRVRPVCDDSSRRWQAAERRGRPRGLWLDSQRPSHQDRACLSDSRGERQSWMGSTQRRQGQDRSASRDAAGADQPGP
jgi:hypothetical protein